MTTIQWQATNSTFSDLSQELLDEIVDYGDALDDPAFFSNCALVCRSLRSRAQWHIYQDISVLTTLRVRELSAHMQNRNTHISSYIKRIMTTAEQLNTGHGLSPSFTRFLAIIKMQSPNSSISLRIVGGNFEVGECLHAFAPSCDYVEASLPECLSIVTSLGLINIQDFPVMVFSHLCRLTELAITNVSFHAARFPASFPFGSLKLLIVKDTEVLPGLVIRCCPQLLMLDLQDVGLSSAGVAAVRTPLPKIKHVFISHLRHKSIKMLVDSLVDVSSLETALDITRFEHLDENNPDESIGDAVSMQYMIHSCKRSLNYFEVNCKTHSYSTDTPQIICALSEFVNLKMLALEFCCINEADAVNTAPYLRDILRTILPDDHILEHLEISIYVGLEVSATNHRWLDDPDYDTLPRVFAQRAWNDVRQALAALATKDNLRIVFSVHGLGSVLNPNTHIVFPTTEGATFRCMMEKWALENLEPELEVGRGQVFRVKTWIESHGATVI
ncbi:hypothetical protein HYPSUDRAFT_68194 [Hypholoma sublateritium FD-334 SS-4]|uniref:Uncharacterized protein n=1 Tax=Hypholoma sublateritium (strain FD-334 SS-4) TaxID=945553 RepID=A0A0D2NQ21_HYPSF|nr:hypothetical protein HYPSUDRAFT_68194 [Hypholoma sublateritium FD-334 SS-4]